MTDEEYRSGLAHSRSSVRDSVEQMWRETRTKHYCWYWRVYADNYGGRGRISHR